MKGFANEMNADLLRGYDFYLKTHIGCNVMPLIFSYQCHRHHHRVFYYRTVFEDI